jgi:hypothetical protein
MKIAIADLKSAAANRPASYLDEAMAAGQVKGEFLHISANAYAKLFAKYRGGVRPFETHVARAVENCPTC